jgi:cytochrome c5
MHLPVTPASAAASKSAPEIGAAQRSTPCTCGRCHTGAVVGLPHFTGVLVEAQINDITV